MQSQARQDRRNRAGRLVAIQLIPQQRVAQRRLAEEMTREEGKTLPESKGEVVLLKPIEAFTRDGLEKAFKLYDIKHGETVILLDASGGGASASEEIAKRGIKAVIACTTMSYPAEEKLRAYGIPVIPSENLNIEWLRFIPVR
jgi:predicted RNase H-like nuclease (RuvC/YqgF family)